MHTDLCAQCALIELRFYVPISTKSVIIATIPSQSVAKKLNP